MSGLESKARAKQSLAENIGGGSPVRQPTDGSGSPLRQNDDRWVCGAKPKAGLGPKLTVDDVE